MLQPLSGGVEDIYGRPFDPVGAEIDSLDEAIYELLRDGILARTPSSFPSSKGGANI